MNYDVSKDTLAMRSLIFEGCQEVPVDLDFSLPDYCPDIQRILKCQVTPNITARSISGDRLNVEGTACIRLLYLDSEHMKVKVCENSSPFSSSINIKTAPENAVPLTSVKIEYINCRAVSPRKVDIHGAFSICSKIIGKETRDVSCCVSGKDIQQKIESVTTDSLIGIGQQPFTISEILEIAENKPPPEMIMRSNAVVVLNDYKIMQNKVVVKGEANIKILYRGDLNSDDLESMEYSIPISQIVDVPGVSEDCKCILRAETLSHDESIHSENEGSPNLISTEIRAVVTVLAYGEKEIGVVADIYSTDYDLDVIRQPIKATRMIDTFTDSFTHKEPIELSEPSVERVIDIWSDSSSVKSTFKNNKLEFNGVMNICILAEDAEANPFYIERKIELKRTKEFMVQSGNVTTEAVLTPISINSGITKSGTIEIRIDSSLQANVYEEQKYNMVTEATADETKPADKDSDASLTIYYAEQGEPIWDIARKYYTSVNSIKQENELTGDAAEKNGMLLIPSK